MSTNRRNATSSVTIVAMHSSDQRRAASPSPPAKDASNVGGERPLLVLKVGTSTILDDGESVGFSLSNLGRLVDAVCHIKARGYQVILISSGAVGAGCLHLKLKTRPSSVQGKQAASAVGQCRMMRLYDDLFALRDTKIGQLILTRTDLLDRTRFVNFKNTLRELLKWDVVPIINENDSLATAQLKFGDNDTLAAYVAVSLEADWLFLLTDVDCLFTSNPRTNPDARPISYVGLVDDVFRLLKEDSENNMGSSWGSGGMHTKIVAAKLAAATGIPTALCNGQHPERVLDIVEFVNKHCSGTECDWPVLLRRWTGQDYCSNITHVHVGCDPAEHQYRSHLDPAAAVGTTTAASESSLESISQQSLPRQSQKEGSPRVPTPGFVAMPSLSEMPFLGTIFAAKERTQKLHDRRRWVLSLPVHGRLYVDKGAADAIVNGKKSLLAVGIRRVVGQFGAGEAVSVCLDSMEKDAAPEIDHENLRAKDADDTDITEFARCIVRFGSDEIAKIIGKHSDQFKGILGSDCSEEEVAHRNTIIFVNPCVVYGCAGACADKAHVSNTVSTVEV